MTIAELERIALLAYYLKEGTISSNESYELTNLVRQFKMEKDSEENRE